MSDASANVVGSVGHILKNAFKGLYAPAAIAAAAAGAATTRASAATVVVPDAAAVAPKGGAAAAAAAGAVGAAVDDDPRAVAQLAAIQAGLDEKRRLAGGLRTYLAAATADAAAADAEEAAALRARGLVLNSEVPQGPSRLVVDSGALREYAQFGAPLVVVSDLFRAAVDDAEYRSGQTRRGTVAPAFTSTEGTPHYLAVTGAQENRNRALAAKREAAAARRAVNNGTVEGAAPASGAAAEAPETADDGEGERADAAAAATTASAGGGRRRGKRGGGGGAPPPTDTLQAEADAKVLKRMGHRVNFLHNPRHGDGVGAPTGCMTLSLRGAAPPVTQWFTWEPRVLEYGDYAAGVTCPPRTIMIRNSSALTRSMRLLPAASRYFVIERVVFPTAGSGLIAPGMSVPVTIRFTPDALSNFADALTIITEQGEFEIPLRATRAPPELDLPGALECGCCLPGDGLTLVRTVTNRGAAGRFKLFGAHEWPPVGGAARDTTPDVLDIAPFTVSPTAFELGTGGKCVLTVRFLPRANGAYKSGFVIVSDNLQVTEYTVSGASCDLDAAVVELQGAPVLARASVDVPPAPLRLRFDPLTPGGASENTVSVTNRSPLEVAFRWDITGWNPVAPRPALTKRSKSGAHAVSAAALRAQEAAAEAAAAGAKAAAVGASAYTVSTSAGSLAAGASATFRLRFCPPALAVYDAVARLSIVGVPVAAALAVDPTQVAASGALQDGSHAALSARMDLVIGTVYLTGTAREAEVSVTPGVISAPPSFAGRVWRQAVRCTNHGASPTTVTFGPPAFVPSQSAWVGDAAAAAAALTVMPASVDVPGGGVCEVVVTYTAPAALGSYALDVVGSVEHGAAFSVRVRGKTVRPVVRVVEHDIDFGLMVISGHSEAAFTVENLSDAPAAWQATQFISAATAAATAVVTARTGVEDESTSDATSVAASAMGCGPRGGRVPDSMPCILVFEPSSGVLPPRSRATVAATCRAGATPHRLRELVRVVVQDADAGAGMSVGAAECALPEALPAFCRVRGEVQSLAVYLNDTAWPAGVVYVGVPATRTVSLVNLSNLPAPFAWSDAPAALGAVAVPALYDVRFEPASGTLGSKETLEVSITVTPRLSGTIDAPLVCDVRGMPAPLGFALTAVSRALVVAFAAARVAAAPPAAAHAGTGAPAPAAPPHPPAAAAAAAAAAALTHADDATALRVATSIAEAAGASVGIVPTLAFGTDFKTFSMKSMTLTLFNLSGISTAVGASVTRYISADQDDSAAQQQAAQAPAADATAGAGAGGGGGGAAGGDASLRGATTATTAVGAGKPPLLGRDHESKRKFASEAGLVALAARSETAIMTRMLAAGAGVALRVSPVEARLPAWGTVTITVTCTADMPGKYTDDLTLDIPGLPQTRVPIKVSVVGSPLEFTDNVAGLSLRPSPVLTWGELVVDSPAVPKVFYVRNTAPMSAVVSWRISHAVPHGGVPRLVDVGLAVSEGGGGGARPSVQVSLTAVTDTRPPPPFKIEPASQLVAARGMTPFTITARPDACVDPDGVWRCTLVGDAAWEGSPGNAARTVAAPLSRGRRRSLAGIVSKAILNLGLQLAPVTPVLSIDKRAAADGRPSIKFGVWDTKPVKHASYTRQITLTNNVGATVTFTASLDGPFKFSALQTNAPKHPLAGDAVQRPQQSMGTRIFTLPQSYSVVADVTFDKDAARAVGTEAAAGARATGTAAAAAVATGAAAAATAAVASSTTTTAADGSGAAAAAAAAGSTPAEAQSRLLQEEYRGTLRISFSNGAVQEVGLRAEVLRPMVVAAPPAYDFGHVHVERSGALKIAVGNPTSVDAEWTLAHVPAVQAKLRIGADPASAGLTLSMMGGDAAVRDPLEVFRPTEIPVDDASVFSFAQMSGNLAGPTKPLAVADVTDLSTEPGATAPILQLRADFKPKLNVLYKSRFRFYVRCGVGFDVVLEGRGSYEETH